MHFFLQGVVGSITSGKSALVHRFLAGEIPKEERLNGCHKKEVLVDGQSYLLLIRNETGSPDSEVMYKLSGMVVFIVKPHLCNNKNLGVIYGFSQLHIL